MANEALRSVLNLVWSSIEQLGQPCALMGGLALAIWNHARFTRDVDLLLGIDRADVDKVVEKLVSKGCRPKRNPPLLIVGDHSFIQFSYVPPEEFFEIHFDLLLAETPLQKSALNRCIKQSIDGVDSPVSVLRCEDLILFKLVAGRMIDRADAAMLLRVNVDRLDLHYVVTWIKQLDLGKDFQQIWAEALPSRELPELGS
jgi:hypothetical protein